MGGEGVEDIKKIITLASLVMFIVSYSVLAILGGSHPHKVYSLDSAKPGDHVVVSGVIVWQRHTKGVTIAELDTGIGRIRLYRRGELPLTDGEYMGIVRVYKGKKELALNG